MRKIIKIILILITIIGLGYCLHYLILYTLLSLGTNRPDGELRPEEIKLFNELKSELHLKKIERTPEYDISNPKKDRSYNIYFEYIDCNISKDSLNSLAKKIVLRVDEGLVLTHKFSSIDLIFEYWDCTHGDVSFRFSRKEINYLKMISNKNIK